MHLLAKHIQAALALILGKRCVICSNPLSEGFLCGECLLKLPYIINRGVAGNPVERVFWGELPIRRAYSLVSYRPGFLEGNILQAIKYKNQPGLARELGRMIATDIISNEKEEERFFATIDAIQAVPLHLHREQKRGYNQSEEIARGISDVTSLPIVHLVKRTKDNASQTQVSHAERHNNVEDIFEVDASASCSYRHILLVDDVITTGATTISCGKALSKKYPSLQFSVISFAFAGTLHPGRLTGSDLKLEDNTIDNSEFRNRQLPEGIVK